MKEYKYVGPTENIGSGDAKCPGCNGSGQRQQTGHVPSTCTVCGGDGKVPGLFKSINQAAAEGWEIVTHTLVGHPPTKHMVIMGREKQANAAQPANPTPAPTPAPASAVKTKAFGK